MFPVSGQSHDRWHHMATWDLPDYQAEAADRMIMCKKIADAAKLNGLIADALKVNRQYRVWLLWYRGRLCTGYLIKMTGVKRASES